MIEAIFEYQFLQRALLPVCLQVLPVIIGV